MEKKKESQEEDKIIMERHKAEKRGEGGDGKVRHRLEMDGSDVNHRAVALQNGPKAPAVDGKSPGEDDGFCIW
ncbi:hypothetical protein HPP92_015645 [Vanilla planifolia]|uniref:Uncharacterized protein n=1 Tax=Vanilla planifolia TaxID=51239 RepID=A0A835QLL3_VANPL|nr:hypothetical protein HPP92_015645 [Vanilla planifolia]